MFSRNLEQRRPSREPVHWVDGVAVNRLLAKGPTHVVASGTSISGEIHVGNAGDIIVGYGIARAVRERGWRDADA